MAEPRSRPSESFEEGVAREREAVERERAAPKEKEPTSQRGRDKEGRTRPQQPTPPEAPTPIAKPEAPEVIRATSGDKYVVKDRGIQRLMTRDEIEQRGGTVPERLQEEQRVHRATAEGGLRGREREQQSIAREKQVKQLSEQAVISSKAASRTLDRFKADPYAEEFLTMRPKDRDSLFRIAGVKYNRNLAQAGYTKAGFVLVGNSELIKQEELDRIGIATPFLVDTLLREGTAAYNKAAKEQAEQVSQRAAMLAQREVYKERKHFEAEVLPQLPEALRQAYKAGGFDAYNRAVEKHNAQIEKDRQAFEVELKDAPRELQEAYKAGGFDAYNRAVETHNNRIKREKIINEAALSKLEPFKDKAGTYDIERFVKKSGLSVLEAERTLSEAGFEQDGIKEAIYASNLSWVKKAWQGTTPWNEAKGETVSLKGAAEMAAVTLVPGVWLKDVKDMKPWQIGVNAGLDLLILIPVAGWAARAGAKTLVKAGTAAITKSLAKELPRALAQAGEKQLARDSIAVAKNIKAIEKSMAELLKAARVTAKAEKAGNIDKFVRAVQVEAAAKTKFANSFRRIGADIGQLNAKIGDTPVAAMASNHLKKAVGMARRADEFADYLADTAKEIVRQGMEKSIPSKVGRFFTRQVKGYGEAVKNIKDLIVASGKTVREGKKAGAAYLSGEGRPLKLQGTTTEAFIKGGEKEVARRLSVLEKELAKDTARMEAKLTQYGSHKTLDRWDRYMRDIWRPGGGSGRSLRPTTDLGEISPILREEMRRSGQAAVATRVQTTGEAVVTGGSATASVVDRAALSYTYTIPIATMAGIRIFTVVVNPETGATSVVPSKQTYTPADPAVTITTFPAIKPLTPAKPYTKSMAQVSPAIKPLTDIQPKPKQAIRQRIKEKVATAIKTAPLAKAGELVKVKPAEAIKVQPAKKLETPLKTETPIKARPVPVPIPLLLGGGTDKQKRKAIRDSKGAIAWRQGELGGKDVWHTLMYPYQSEADYLTVLGRKPPNTTIVKGPRSAYQTIKLLYGKAPSRKVTGDIGFFDFFIEPRGNRKVGIGFKPDPKMETAGDITIGRPTPSITERAPRLSGKSTLRITPKRPRLRR